MRTNKVKRALGMGKPQVGTWLSLCSGLAARFLVRTPFHWLTIDIEHSPYDWSTAANLFALISDAGGVPIARVPAGHHDLIKRALDGGALGIIVPMVMDRAEAQACVAAAKYPPAGNRSIGGLIHALNFSTSVEEYYAHANEEVLVILQCEHIQAVRDADSIFSVPGIDAIFIGPNDLRASMRGPDGKDPSPAELEQAIQDVLSACKRNGVPAGIHCFSARDVKRRIDEGFQFVALSSDIGLLLQAVRSELDQLALEPN